MFEKNTRKGWNGWGWTMGSWYPPLLFTGKQAASAYLFGCNWHHQQNVESICLTFSVIAVQSLFSDFLADYSVCVFVHVCVCVCVHAFGWDTNDLEIRILVAILCVCVLCAFTFLMCCELLPKRPPGPVRTLVYVNFISSHLSSSAVAWLKQVPASHWQWVWTWSKSQFRLTWTLSTSVRRCLALHCGRALCTMIPLPALTWSVAAMKTAPVQSNGQCGFDSCNSMCSFVNRVMMPVHMCSVIMCEYMWTV